MEFELERDHGSSRRPRGYAQEIGRGQIILEKVLADQSRQGQDRASDKSQDGTRDTQLPENEAGRIIFKKSRQINGRDP